MNEITEEMKKEWQDRINASIDGPPNKYDSLTYDEMKELHGGGYYCSCCDSLVGCLPECELAAALVRAAIKELAKDWKNK